MGDEVKKLEAHSDFNSGSLGLPCVPLTWLCLARQSTNYQYPHLWDDFYSIGFVACAVSAVFG